MIRTQIMLTEAQAAALKQAAARQGESVTSIIRRAVDNEIASARDEEELWVRGFALCRQAWRR